MKFPGVSLSRRGKIVRNLIALACVLALCAALPRLPLLLVEGRLRSVVGTEDFRVLWRGNLLCRPVGGGGVPLAGLDADGQQALPAVLALGEGRVWGCYMASYEGRAGLSGVETWPAEGALSLLAPVPLGDQQLGRSGFTALLAAVNLPEGTVSGRLSLEIFGEAPRLSQGTREGDVLFFLIPGDETWGSTRTRLLEGASFLITALDGEGRPLAECRGILGEALL